MENAKLLRRTLWANVIFSEICAVVAIIFSDKWIAINDLTTGQGLPFGIMLLIFSALVAFAALKKKVSRKLVWIIVILDLLYVLMALLRLVFDPSFSISGWIVTAFTMLVVLALAILQIRGLKLYTNQKAL